MAVVFLLAADVSADARARDESIEVEPALAA